MVILKGRRRHRRTGGTMRIQFLKSLTVLAVFGATFLFPSRAARADWQDRQDARQEARDDRQDTRDDNFDDRQDAVDQGPDARQDDRQGIRENRQDARQGARALRQGAR